MVRIYGSEAAADGRLFPCQLRLRGGMKRRRNPHMGDRWSARLGVGPIQRHRFDSKTRDPLQEKTAQTFMM